MVKSRASYCSLIFTYFLRERLRSIVMSTCMCVCLSVRISPEAHARCLPNILCMLLMAVARSSRSNSGTDEMPRWSGNFVGFLPHWQCTVRHSIRDPYKNGWTDRDAVWHDEWAWPEEQCVKWGDDLRRESDKFGKNMSPTSLTSLLIVNRTGPCSYTRQGHTLDCKCWTTTSLLLQYSAPRRELMAHYS